MLRASLSTQVHLWVSDLDVWNQEVIASLLTPDELTRARTIRHPLAQQNYLVGRALVRTTLSHYVDIEPSNWTFSTTRFGRPEITGPQPVAQLRFNLTHTPGLAACVVTETAGCGVDVEELDRPLRPLRIAEHSFAPEEFRDLESRPEQELRERFFCYWTLKESYYKALGSGIPFRLGNARFELVGDHAVSFAPSEGEQTTADTWQFEIFRPTNGHILSVAVEHGRQDPLTLKSFANSSDGPATSFAPVDLVPVRSSENFSS